MATIKSRKITKIVREFVKQDASYDITGVDLGLAKYLWRVSQDTFQDLAAGDYRIDQSNGKQTLVILNAELLAQAEAFQVGYVLDFTASEYDTEWNVDINQLKEKYNTLVQNTQSLWEYVRLTGFIADDTTINLILPQLDDNQFWFYQDGKYKAYDVSDFRQLGESLIEAYAEYQKSVIELMVRNARENIQNNVDNGAASIQNLLNSLNLSVENFTGDKKLELQKIINDFRKELEVVSVGNANTVQGYVPMDFDRVENTIKDLQNSKKYKIGDVIEVLGYYTAGDGAGHKRKIEETDDGSGVQLANGLWGNIVHNGEVNIDWFGAKMYVDCYEIFMKALSVSKTVILSSGKKYICNGRVDVNNKRIILGEKTVLEKNSGIDEPIIWCNGNNFVIEGAGLGSLITSTMSLTLGVICVGNLGMDGVGRNVLYGNIRHLELSSPSSENAANGSCTISFVGPQYSGLANYFHHMDDVRITGGDSGVLMWGWANGNNFSNLHFYGNKTKAFYFKEIAEGSKCPLDNNITNVFHHSSPNAHTLYMEGGSTNIITGLNCEQGGIGAQSIFMTKECRRNTFITSSNTASHRTIQGETNNIIDTYGGTMFGDLRLIHNYSSGTTGGLGFIREYNFNMRNLKEGTTYKLVKFGCGVLNRTESIIVEVTITERHESGIPVRANCKSIYRIAKDLAPETLSKLGFSYDLIKEGNDYFLVTKTFNNGTGTNKGHISVNVRVQRENTSTEITTEQFEEYNGVISKSFEYDELNTPYHATKMQQDGVYEDFITYMDEKTEYDRLQREQPEGVMMLPVIEEPQPSEKLLAFKEKYLG